MLAFKGFLPIRKKNVDFFPRAQKSNSQKRFREAVAGEEPRGGKEKKKHKSGHIGKLPEVSRVEVEEVGWSSESRRRS